MIPASLQPDANPLIRADRAYQIAAAYFYAGDFDEAERRFAEIAQDTTSPWHEIAPYLAARAIVRKATVGAPPGQIDQAGLAKAELQLQKILADQRLTPVHPAALRLMDFVRIRLYRDVRFAELANAVLQKGSASTLRQNLCDYLRLMGRFRVEHPDDLTDWVLTFRASNPQALSHALEKWKASSSTPWLVAALSKVAATDLRAPDLMVAAESVPTSSVAYPTIAYHRIRLMADSGESDAARDLLDKLLAKRATTLSLSSRNLFLSLRLRVARNMEEFLKFAVRETAGIYEEGQNPAEMPAQEASGLSFAAREAGKLRFDPSASRFLNDRVPLSVLANIVKQNSFPSEIQRDLAQAAWVRAVLLADHARGVELRSTLAKLIPELRELLDVYSSAPTIEAKGFAAVLLLLKFPGLKPLVTSGLERRTPVGELDDLRENWWCPFQPSRTFDIPNFFKQRGGDSQVDWLLNEFPDDRAVLPEFLPPSEKQEAMAERNKLIATGAAPDYLAKQVLAWAKIHPQDPRVPEALHRVVRATRLGCRDDDTAKFSKAAFQFLHQHYPQSEWAKKTKYWY